MAKTAVIFDIERFRNEDGPGIRTIIFFKGCPLRCDWCSNPFGLAPAPQLVVNQERCVGCGNCVAVCPDVNRLVNQTVRADFSKCRTCGKCVPVCPVGARKIMGKEYTVHDLFQEVAKDAAFYRRSGGGVTLSGGEVLLQYEAAADLLKRCRKNYISTCIETSAFAPWEQLEQVARYCDYVFVDLKHTDDMKHKERVGVSNKLILSNIQRLCSYAAERETVVIVRKPIIPDYNDDDAETIRTAEFLSHLAGSPEINLLPYHNFGESKYEMIGLTYPMSGTPVLEEASPEMKRVQSLLQAHAPANRVSIGGGEIAAK